MINLVRCDDRLIHGQCMTVIVKHYKIDNIIAIDNFISGNQIMKNIFRTAAPPGIRVEVYSPEEAMEPICKALDDSTGTLVLVSSPMYLPKLYDEIPRLPKSANIGPMSKRGGTKEAIFEIYVTKEEIDSLKNLVDKGIDVYFNAVPENTRASWDKVKGKLL